MALSIRTRRTVVAITGTASLLVAGATLADAAVSTGVITVCVEKGNQELHLKTRLPCPRGWTALSFNARGVAGLTGLRGAAGLVGVAGPAGAAGPAGSPGLAGVPGIQGPPGPQGASGSGGGGTGPQGPAGATGATGAAGAAGAAGPAGVTDGDVSRQSGTALIPVNFHSEVVSYDAAPGKHLLAHAKLTVSAAAGTDTSAFLVTCTLGTTNYVPVATPPNDSATVGFPQSPFSPATVALTNSYNTTAATTPTHISVTCTNGNGGAVNVTNAVLDVIELTDIDDETPAPAVSPVANGSQS